MTVSETELNKDFFKPDKFYGLGDSGIVFFDSVKRFVESASDIWWVSNERHRNHHLVYVPGLTTLDITKTFKDGFLIDHVNFLMHETNNSRLTCSRHKRVKNYNLKQLIKQI